ncbi:DNA helicase/exodeoxyribonuclease V, beta subunit [Modicisalibacter muralis]|uniref:RecBCD enzyme subunit RecB n=1 Tax=Modicisalibacter muralis TaxID=119000 RepID=A0A1G9PG84_9GAMM|nr:exodeoxyribonuclease V subunit beta [Halomonas muralis]SDL97165.1 DNA helicase/exodeoxyribonuclease V, beta subunit [Halomonas muralis]
MSDVTPLDPLAFPLHGSRLIEASAGTGKTFTIALLYVRLVLGARSDQDDAAFARPLTPPEILVVTFTNAATQELRERIRTRLVEAAGVFLQTSTPSPNLGGAPGADRNGGHSTGMSNVAPREGVTAPPRRSAPGSAPSNGLDPLLLQLRDDYDEASWPACARRLQLAAEWMDEAAVSTIHSWCYRMLREHAFDSGSLFSLNLETDQTELEAEVVRDYWRSFYYPMDADALAIVTRYWDSPEALHAQVRRLLPECDALPGNVAPPEQTLRQTQSEIDNRLAELKAPWAAWVDECEALFEEAAKQKAFKGQNFNSKSRANWLGALRDWCQGEALRPALTPAAWKRLTPDGMAEIWLKGEPPDHPALAALAELPAQLDALPDPRADLLTHAVHWCRARLDREQERRAEMGPNELMTHLDRALAGPNGAALSAQIRRQFPVAMVDEFQDTDPVQYRIFDGVYRIAENHPETGLFLIGDPKQAIYAFRGADIYTYLRARHDTAGRHVTLGTNFRSARPMVEAVNRCFDVAEQHPPGAFLFKQADGSNSVPFQGVKAKGRKDAFTLDGQPLPAMTLWQLDADEPLAKTAYHAEMAERCATAMATLLEQGQSGRAGFMDSSSDDAFTAVKPSDMAVLVNGLGEARAIRQALARRGVKSVYLSDKDKVFASFMAAQLEAWLRACAEPGSSSNTGDRLLRTALAMPALGLDIAALDAMNADELAWEDRVMQFRDYHRLWQTQGVLPLVRRLMNDFAVPARLLAGGPASEGERWLTDLLHLGELLQQASQELDGEHALIRFLAESRANPDDQGDTHKLRLESDADLVQVITIHKSKGLEYPLVFLPFICGHRPKKPDDSPLRWHDDNGQLRISLDADDATLAIADRERLGEDLRKLYVALTRARHATWLGMAPLKGLESSAIGQLLANGESLDPAAFGAALATLKGDCEAIALAPAPTIESRVIALAEHDEALGDALTPVRPAREHWWIASYSALRFSGEASAIEPQAMSAAATDTAPFEPTTAVEATAVEVMEEPRDSATVSEPAPSLHKFPRGPGPGTFLHGLLEWAGQQGFANVATQPAALEDTLARRCNLRGWTQWIPTLHDWLGALLTTLLPLPAVEAGASDLRLDALSTYQVELEFWFAASEVDTRMLDDLVCRHTLGNTPRPRADRDRLNGMLKGFIDLVFEFEGRYYVADWKSNHLGPDDDAYTPEAMRLAVAGKRYDLQYALYLLALHRLLKARLADYDYDRHIGGSLTVFLRGTNAASRGVHAERPPRELIESLDVLFQGANAAEPTTTEAHA